MIGEPEIDGDRDAASGAAGFAEDLPREREREHERERIRGPRAPWRWALGGAVAASAVWAGTLAVQDRFADTPRIDYRHSADLCREVPLTTLGETIGRAFEGDGSSESLSPAQDWAYCRTGPKHEKERVLYMAQVLVELHKKTDPGTEFATGPGSNVWPHMDAGERREVPGLGDRAVLDRHRAAGGARLTVLDGGAVFTLTVEWFGPLEEASGGVDEDSIDGAMIEDVRALMAKLKR